VRPDAQRSGAGELEELLQQRGAEAPAPERGMHDEFRLVTVQTGVPDEAVAVADDDVAASRRAAVL
jgi:hypothetical protein